MSALDKQEGGTHYKDLAIQPVEYIQKNNLSYLQGNVIKYITRYNKKNSPIDDLNKAKHYIDLILELEYLNSTYEDLPENRSIKIPRGY
jgi:hypothetical protein